MLWSRRAVLAASLGLGVGASGLTGCREELPLPPVPTPEPVLHFLTFADGPDEAVMQTLCDRFSEQSGIRVKMEVIPFANMHDTLRARIDRGAQPDVARIVQVAPFAGDVLDLRQYEPEAFQSPFRAEFDEVILDGGRMIAAPSDVTVTGLFLNLELFRRARVPAPGPDHSWPSWQEMFLDAMKVKAAGGSEYAFVMDVSPARFCSMISSFGTNFFDGRGALALETGALQAALDRFMAMNDSAGMPKELFTQAGGEYKSAAEVFAAGQAPVYLAGSWQVAAFSQDLEFDWSVAPNIRQERTGAFPGAKFLIALKHGRQQEAARFIAFMTSAGAQLELGTSVNHMPTRRDVQAVGVEYDDRAEEMAVFAAELEAAPADAWGTILAKGFPATGQVLQDQLEKLLQGTATTDGAAATIVEAARANAT